MQRPLVALVVMGAFGIAAAPAPAETCAAHPNQATAQRAADTRDADGDGVYCESLPCPCAKGGSSGGKSKPQPLAAPVARARVTEARITSVIDGDTIRVRELAGGRSYVTVRLVGIDTPETRHPGRPVECGGKAATSAALRFSFTAPSDNDGDGLLDREGGEGKRVTLRTRPHPGHLRPLRAPALVRDNPVGAQPADLPAFLWLGQGLLVRPSVPEAVGVP